MNGNIEVKQEGNVLVIRIPMQAPTPSTTGKTLVVASTHGNIETPVQVQGKTLKLGLNAYISAR